jgi:hypothetical protein
VHGCLVEQGEDRCPDGATAGAVSSVAVRPADVMVSYSSHDVPFTLSIDI